MPKLAIRLAAMATVAASGVARFQRGRHSQPPAEVVDMAPRSEGDQGAEDQ